MSVESDKVSSIFAVAADLASPAQRAAYLDAACGQDARLREQVEELLQHDDAAGSFLQPRAPAVAATCVQDTAERPGMVIGPYKLLEQIGEGGMGTVYMAEQSHPVQRKVALKVIKAGMDSGQVIARFEAERQALALMDHPNIAKVFDAGTTAAGRPYFVMELVKGVPITQYCDENHLAPKARLELFTKVCHAVQHAHQKGIIHRDIKPTNVLVTLYDDKPAPKVIDFGVAKATGSRLTERTMFTGYGQIVGTLEYMSPEQARLNALDIDTRGDIYSLGVLLYELLTGTTPFDKKRLREAAFDEMLRMIREEEPPKPSTRLSTSEGRASIAANRSMEPDKLSGLVRGELDWIVMKALEKDRNRRYETANGFARDVQRYLADEPVQACPPSAGYRLRKFVRRNKTPVLAASLVLLALLSGTIGTTWGLFRAIDAEAEARAEAVEKDKARAQAVLDRNRAETAEKAAKRDRDQARAAQADTQAFSDFLVKYVLAAARPQGLHGGQGVNVTVAQALEAAEGKLDVLFAGRPNAEATARHEIGLTFLHLGRYDKAEVLLRRALVLRGQELGPDAQETLSSQFSLGWLFNWSGRNWQGVPLYEDTLRRQTATLGRDHHDTLITMTSLAATYQGLGQLDKALPLLEETLARQKVTYRTDPDHWAILATKNNLGVWHRMAGQMDKALPLLEATLEKRKSLIGAGHPETLVSMWRLGEAYVIAGRPTDGMPLVEEAVKQMPAQFGPQNGQTQAAARALGRLRALLECQAAYERAQAAKGADHLATLATRQGLAGIYNDLNALTLSEAHYRAVYETARDALGTEHPRTLSSQSALAALLLRRERFVEAELHLRAWLNVQKRKGPEDWMYFNRLSLLGASLLGQEKFVLAEPLLVEGYEGLNRHASEVPPALAHHSVLSRAMQRLVQLYSAWGKKDQAVEWQKKLETQWAIEMKKASGATDWPIDC